jgi:hypothetical protein
MTRVAHVQLLGAVLFGLETVPWLGLTVSTRGTGWPSNLILGMILLLALLAGSCIGYLQSRRIERSLERTGMFRPGWSDLLVIVSGIMVASLFFLGIINISLATYYPTMMAMFAIVAAADAVGSVLSFKWEHHFGRNIENDGLLTIRVFPYPINVNSPDRAY